ncbi:unnamed protein product [Moneuplotes crassus]|uniref:NADP-dependent oxidoreductase domain-containing protein n=1 Tax=Euplotes crassus TaxID=5936 RepID=A0AAD1XN01_EUPCR|nr:unnamed protein product [Moneuplotes crassus]
MEIIAEGLQLNSGHQMPVLGLGTYLSFDRDTIIKNVKHAVIDCGYRLIDTASAYENEEAIGEALQQCFEAGIKREDLFITTKCFKTEYEDPEKALKTSLERLKLDYVDLYHIHWCMTMIDFDKMEVTGPPIHKVWEKFEKLSEEGLAKSIGVCNANVMMLVELLAGAKVKPSVVQVELHPYLQQEGLVNTCQRFNIQLTAMAPLGAPGFPYSDGSHKILEDEIIKEIADKHGCTPSQVILAWNIQRKVSVIPKSTNNDRIKENKGAEDITLDSEDLNKIKTLNKGHRFFDPGMWIEPESGWFNLSDFD